MYEEFYGLTDKPFSMLPDPGFLYLSKQHQTALTLLQYALVNRSGFCVVTGEPGAGKTTLLRKLLETVEDTTAVGMITNTHKSFGELMDWVLSAFDIHEPGLDRVQQNQKFTDFLLTQYAQGKTCLLIVDEAQNIEAGTLEELRMLSNLNSEKDQILQIILAGQPDLKKMLCQPELMQLAQRIGVDYHLGPLGETETCCYIQHRLITAGASDDVFTPKACKQIYRYSGGIPRLINLICDTSMVYGFADQARWIGEDVIELMVCERMQDSVVPLFKDIEPAQGKLLTAAEELSTKPDEHFPWINPERSAGTTVDTKAQEKNTATASSPSADGATAKKLTSVIPDHHKNASQQQAKKEDAPAMPQAENSRPEPEPARSTSVEPPESDKTTSVDNTVAPSATAPQQAAFAPAEPPSVPPPDPPASAPPAVVQPKRNRGWWLAGIGAMLLVLLAVIYIAISNNREIERMQAEAEKQLQMEIERKEQAAAELAKKLEWERQQKLEREHELKRRAELLQKQRDEALKKAEEEAAERARQQKLAEKMRLQKEAEKKRLMLEARKKRLEAELKLQREQAELKEKLLQQQLMLQRIEEEKKRKRAEQQAAERARRLAEAKRKQQELAAQQAQAEQQAADAAAEKTDTEKQGGFSSDPCSGPTARFTSICR